jgi:hypothetical protein
MNCAKIKIANTSDRCDEEPALVIVVVLDELDFGSCIVNLYCFCYLRTRYFLQRIAAMKASITPTSISLFYVEEFILLYFITYECG